MKEVGKADKKKSKIKTSTVFIELPEYKERRDALISSGSALMQNLFNLIKKLS